MTLELGEVLVYGSMVIAAIGTIALIYSIVTAPLLDRNFVEVPKRLAKRRDCKKAWPDGRRHHNWLWTQSGWICTQCHHLELKGKE